MDTTSVLISLTHFCDKHGPRIISVTQCSNITNIPNDLNNTDSTNGPIIRGGEDLLVPNYPIDSYCESCLLQFPDNPTSSSPDESKGYTSDDIKSMRSILGGKTYVTTQYSSIRFQKLNSITRKVFSEETMIYDSSPFIFYDENRGLNLSMGFKLYDENARGNERRYCLILTIDHFNIELAMNLLSQNWNFILLGFKKIINYIKQLHQNVLNGKNNHVNNINYLTHFNEINSNGSTQNGKMSSNDGNIFIGNYLRANKTKIAKNLIELTNDRDIFIKLHKWNSYLICSLINSDVPSNGKPEKL